MIRRERAVDRLLCRPAYLHQLEYRFHGEEHTLVPRCRPADAIECQFQGCGPSRKRPCCLLQRCTLAIDAADHSHVWLEDRCILESFSKLRDRRLELAVG